MSIENKLEKLGLFFVKSINLYRAYSLKDNPLLDGVVFNKDVKIAENSYHFAENTLSDVAFFRLLDNIEKTNNSSFYINNSVLKLISDKLSNITMNFMYNNSLKNKQDFLNQFKDEEINKIKNIIYYFKNNEYLLNNYKKNILKCCGNVYSFFSKKDVNDPEHFPEYNDIVYSLLKDDNDFKYTLNSAKRIYLGLPKEYMEQFFLSRNEEKQKKYQKEILKKSGHFIFLLPFYFKIEKENLHLLYKLMKDVNENNTKNMSKKDLNSFDFSSEFIKLEAFSQPEFIKKLLSDDKTINTFFKFRDIENKKNMTSDVGIFDSIFKSFINRPELLNEKEIQDLRSILNIIKNHIQNDEKKFNHVFYNAFSSRYFGNTPSNYAKINQVLNIIFEFDSSLLNNIFKKEKILNEEGCSNYLNLQKDYHLNYNAIWNSCTWDLYKSALQNNFYNSLDIEKTKKISKKITINNIYSFITDTELKEAISFISDFNKITYNQICEDVFSEYSLSNSYLHNKDKILSCFSWENELKKLDIIISNISEEHLNNRFGSNCINYYSCLLKDNNLLNTEPLKKYFLNKIIQNISDDSPVDSVISNNLFFSFVSLLNPTDINGDVNQIKDFLLKIEQPYHLLKNKNFWDNSKWNENNTEFKNILFISLEKELLKINVEEQPVFNNKKRRM